MPYGLFTGLNEQIEQLRHRLSMESLNEADRLIYDHAISEIGRTCRAIEHATKPVQCGMIFMPLSVREEFVGFLKTKQPFALVLLAYYCTQLHAFSHFWFVKQRAGVVLSGISAEMPSEYADLLKWPNNFCTSFAPFCGWWILLGDCATLAGRPTIRRTWIGHKPPTFMPYSLVRWFVQIIVIISKILASPIC